MSDENTIMSNHRVLFVEDDPELRGLLPHIFYVDDAVDADIAVCGADGWQKYCEAQRRGEPYDLIVSDISMPDLTGTMMAKRIRDTGDTRTMLAFYTAWDGAINRHDAEDVGAVAMWTKGEMTPVQLRENICALLGGCERRHVERRKVERRTTEA